MITVRQALAEGNRILRSCGMDMPLDARVLLCHALGYDTLELAVHANDPLDGERFKIYMDYIQRRTAHELVSYITGIREFMGLDFRVNPGVLIPRPETELLAELAIELFADRRADILDLCCGSGAIGVSVAVYAKNVRVTSVDISETALECTKKNAELLGVSDRVDAVLGDVLSDSVSFAGGKNFDAVFSNPPYIPDGDVENLDADVHDYEPSLALCGGTDGLKFYRAIVSNAVKILKCGGFLAFETGYDQAESVREIMGSCFENISVKNDLAGIGRMVCGVLKQHGVKAV